MPRTSREGQAAVFGHIRVQLGSGVRPVACPFVRRAGPAELRVLRRGGRLGRARGGGARGLGLLVRREPGRVLPRERLLLRELGGAGLGEGPGAG